MGAPTPAKQSGIVFVSGGSAVNRLASVFADAGPGASHVISVFDNGGSTGRLRRACGDLAVGDLRNRMLALARPDSAAGERMAGLFSHRLTGNKPREVFRAAVQSVSDGDSELLDGIPDPARSEIREALAVLAARLPANFDWREAVIGNLILQGRRFQVGGWPCTLDWAHRLLSVAGLVVPATTDFAHIGARLANGRYVLGQKTITDNFEKIEAPVQEIRLHPSEQSYYRVARVKPYPRSSEALREASVIVYGWGSFYTSLLCTLLVEGLPGTILANSAPKVLLLNPFRDAETLGKRPGDLAGELARFAAQSGQGRMLTHVVAVRATSDGSFYTAADRAQLERSGLQVTEVECERFPQDAQLRWIMDYLLELAEER